MELSSDFDSAHGEENFQGHWEEKKERQQLISGEDRNILNEFTERVRRHFPGARIWAFGSRVRGIAAWDSDLDICIVLDHLDKKTDGLVRDIAWEVGFENERVISTIVLDSDQFEKGPMSESTLVDNILREGVAA